MNICAIGYNSFIFSMCMILKKMSIVISVLNTTKFAPRYMHIYTCFIVMSVNFSFDVWGRSYGQVNYWATNIYWCVDHAYENDSVCFVIFKTIVSYLNFNIVQDIHRTNFKTNFIKCMKSWNYCDVLYAF